MSRSVFKAVAVLFGLMISGVAMAQDGSGSTGLGLIGIGAGLAIGLAAFGAASAQGRAVGSAVEGIARNPNAKGEMFQSFILGLVFMEFQALLGFAMAFILAGKI